ncbi:MAG: TetR/AcrR family transcriptional regulator [Flavobacteriales bacterium]|jgi:TetR/AcrR family transcriptional regulator, fatty acid metabolism regulator protein|nr:TetR/AcrR family transcriptional regulator [Flavobacteriales bacterium]
MDLSKRQIEIIEAATQLIGKGGVKSLTTKTLAAEMGFSEPALYRHFADKNEILKSVLIYYKEKLKEGLTNVINSDLSGKEKIKGMIDFQFGHFTKYPAVIMVIFSETSFQYNSQMSKLVSEIMRQKSSMVSGIIESGQQEGSIRADIAPEQLATMIMGSMRFTILRWRLSNFDFNLIQEGNILWNTIELLINKE